MHNIELAAPQRLTAAERTHEIAIILATAITRTHQKATENEFVLGFAPGKSVHTTPYQRERLS